MPPRLLDGLYPGIAPASGKGDFWRGYFMTAGSPDDPLFSHLPRFQLTARIKDFYAAEFRAGLGPFDPLAELRARLPAGFGAWSPLARAAYLEITTLLSSYLLSSQGDRMAMAHGVEARVPYLDHRLVEFAAALPARSKLRGLREKNILRRWGEATGLLPAAVAISGAGRACVLRRAAAGVRGGAARSREPAAHGNLQSRGRRWIGSALPGRARGGIP